MLAAACQMRKKGRENTVNSPQLCQQSTPPPPSPRLPGFPQVSVMNGELKAVRKVKACRQQWTAREGHLTTHFPQTYPL